jgi:hypothetical protein
MTEREWLKMQNLEAGLRFVRPKASARKLRLFAVACCRRVWELLPEGECRLAVEVAEKYADGLVTREQLRKAAIAVNANRANLGSPAASVTEYYPGGAARWASGWAAYLVRRHSKKRSDEQRERRQQCALLRELFGPLPFRAVTIDPLWLAWSGGTIGSLAQTIYDERRFDEAPVLADALEEAGCSDKEILAHLREPAGHVKGCWVLDLLLARS